MLINFNFISKNVLIIISIILDIIGIDVRVNINIDVSFII